MAYEIDQEWCVHCGKCFDVCPNGAVSEDCVGNYIIDPDECIQCGACLSVCVMECIDYD